MTSPFLIPLWATAIVLLFGCSSIPFKSMYSLRHLDPLTAQPESIRIAIRTSDAIGLQKGDVRMSLGYIAEDKSLVIEDVYLVDVSQRPPPSHVLLNDLADDEAITILYLNESDARQMSKTQTRIAQQKAKNLKGKGSFGVGIHSSCSRGPLPIESLLVDVLIQTDPDGEFILLIDDLDLYQQDGIEKFDTLPPCNTDL